MHTLTIKLKQHTPILHFQEREYARYGATLRATELKPKLDRFIMANYKVDPDWKIGKTSALNYKLKVLPCRSIDSPSGKQPMFFGKSKTSLIFNSPIDDDSEDVKLEIFCLNTGLLSCLKELDWNSFFLVTNFGTRQSKGYGSFFIAETPAPVDMIGKEVVIERKNNSVISYRVDSFFSPQFNDGEQTSWKKIMDCISDVYKCIRSGINEDGLYFKSLMFAYAKSKGLWWDKRVIKERLFPDKLKEHRLKHPDRNEPDPLAEKPVVAEGNLVFPMFRDLLGLASIETGWRDEYETAISKKDIRNEVSRFKSPILFKPLFINGQWYIFLLHREIPLQFKNTVFKVGGKGLSASLRMKPYDGFSMSDYMNYLWRSIPNYDQYVETSDESAEERADGILEDLNELRRNYKTT